MKTLKTLATVLVAIVAVVAIQSVIWLGSASTDADVRDNQQTTNASYMLVEPQTTWQPLVMCPAGEDCI